MVGAVPGLDSVGAGVMSGAGVTSGMDGGGGTSTSSRTTGGSSGGGVAGGGGVGVYR